MRIYLDEDLASALLAALLRKAGHDVETPASTGLLGRADPVQLACAIRLNHVCLTRNNDDFEDLHLLIEQAQGHHPGILVVRRENNPTRDMTAKDIVSAIRKLESANVPIQNEYIVLNQWR